MQRRAAALYSLFFLLIAAIAGAYSMVAESAVAGAQTIVVLSVITALLLISLSYIPSRG